MANIRKQFNFRNGVQVDNDNLVVSPTGLVGIGTTIPTEALDVRGGNASVSGFITATQLKGQSLVVYGTADIDTLNLTNAVTGSGVSVGSGIITATDPSGIVTYYGDARFLQGLPTSQWLDTDVGLGFTSIYNKGFVGIATNDPRHTLQIGGGISTTAFNYGVGIHSSGDIYATGIVTAFSFSGIGSDITLIDGANIGLGTISNDRLPILDNSRIPDAFQVSGIITASGGFSGNLTGNVTGNLTGIATGADNLVGSPDVVVGILTANAVSASSFIGGIVGDVTGTATTATSLTPDANVDIADLTVGIATVSTFFNAEKIGIGTNDSAISADLLIKNYSDPAVLQLVSDNLQTEVALGRSESTNGINALLRFGNTSLSDPYSLYEALDIINSGNGNINFYLDYGNSGIGTGNYYWHYKTNQLMTLTNAGKLGIGVTNPEFDLDVSGITSTTTLGVQNGADIGTDLVVGGNVSAVGAASSLTVRQIYIQGGQSGILDQDGTEIFSPSNTLPLNITAGVSTVSDLYIDGRATIDSDYTTGGGLSINPVTYRETPFAAVQIGYPLDFFTQDVLGIGGTIDQDSVSEITLLDNGQIGIGTTALDNQTALTVYGDSVIERLAIGVGVTEMTTGVLNVKGPILVSEGNLTDATSGTPSADIKTVGIVTAGRGFMSGAGTTGVHIDVNGSVITFSVPGVGTTTLNLV
tara:strand:+ start:2196 stop:4292 length:2097 start_codon:yes stop_codon:yes gene_type:complete